MWVAHFAPALLARPYTRATLPALALASQFPALIACTWNIWNGYTVKTRIDGGLDVAPVSPWTSSLAGISVVGALISISHFMAKRSIKDAITMFFMAIAPFGLNLMLREDMSILPPQNRAPVLKPARPATYHIFTALPLLVSTLTYILSLRPGSPRNTAALTLPATLSVVYGLASFFHVSPDTKGVAWMGLLAVTLYYFRVLERTAAGRESVTIPVPKAADNAAVNASEGLTTAKAHASSYVSSATATAQSGFEKAKNLLPAVPVKSYVDSATATAQSGMQKAKNLINAKTPAVTSTSTTSPSVTERARNLVGTLDPASGLQKAREYVATKVGNVKGTPANITSGTPSKMEYAGDGKWKVVKGDVSETAATARVGDIAAALE